MILPKFPINDINEYINIKNDINIETHPSIPTNLIGLLENPIIPSDASELQNPSMLKEMIARNTALKNLVDRFRLVINKDNIPF